MKVDSKAKMSTVLSALKSLPATPLQTEKSHPCSSTNSLVTSSSASRFVAVISAILVWMCRFQQRLHRDASHGNGADSAWQMCQSMEGTQARVHRCHCNDDVGRFVDGQLPWVNPHLARAIGRKGTGKRRRQTAGWGEATRNCQIHRGVVLRQRCLVSWTKQHFNLGIVQWVLLGSH